MKGLALGLVLFVVATACGDREGEGEGGGSGGDVAGSPAAGGAGPAADCPPTCFRAVNCVLACAGPSVSSGCCPCEAPAFDDLTCGLAGAAQ